MYRLTKQKFVPVFALGERVSSVRLTNNWAEFVQTVTSCKSYRESPAFYYSDLRFTIFYSYAFLKGTIYWPFMLLLIIWLVLIFRLYFSAS